MTEPQIYRLAQVFVVGRVPTVTYSPRDARRVEAAVGDYLEERGRILVVTGPSKSGKTVLLQRTVPDAIWLSGGQIASIDAFWRQIVDQAGGWTGEVKELSRTDTEGSQSGTSAQFKPAGVGADASLGDSTSVADTSRHQRTAQRDPQGVGARILAAMDEALVVDDFHHMSPKLQREVVRQLKPLVDRGLAVILAAVPHRAADAVMAESEMESRVETLHIGLWDRVELADIARKGFRQALGVNLLDELIEQLATYSFNSPHLMQLLCRELSKANGIRQTVVERVELHPPPDWDLFLAEVAVRYTSEQSYRDLVRGPQSRKDRTRRVLRPSGEGTDIYGALMVAIRMSGPTAELSYNALRELLRSILENLPQKEQITNPLKHMTTIAYEHAQDEYGRLKRDPALEWQPEKDTLYIADPYLKFRIRCGPPLHRSAGLEASLDPPRLIEGTPSLPDRADGPPEAAADELPAD